MTLIQRSVTLILAWLIGVDTNREVHQQHNDDVDSQKE